MEPLDRRRRILVNRSEELTDAALREAADGLGLRVDAKTRVADAVEIDRSGLSDEAYRYALRAHLDWVVSDLETTRAEFAVEFDGASHDTPAARQRDALKNEICARLGLPILRIDAAVLRPAAQRTVLSVLLESWTSWQAFLRAQESGALPWGEPYDPAAFVELDSDTGELLMPLDLTQPVRRRVRRMVAAGVLARPIVATRYRGPRPNDPDGAEAYAWVYTTDRRVVIGHARVREYSFPALLPFELAESLAHLDLGDRLARWREGDESIPVGEAQAEAQLPQFHEDWSGGGG